MTPSTAKKTAFSIIFTALISSLSISQEIKFTKKNGVETIENPISPPVSLKKTSHFKLKEDLVIGRESERTDYVFGSLIAVCVDAPGNIYALDNKDVSVKVFDGNGQFLYSFARKGQGPGELGLPMDIIIVENSLVAIPEFGNNRISYFKKSGEFIRSISLGKYRMWQFIIDSKHHIYGENLNLPSMELLLFDKNMNLTGKVASFLLENTENPPPLQLYQRFRFALNSKDQLIWARNDGYTMNLVDEKLQIFRTISRDFVPVKVTSAFVRNELHKMNPERRLPEQIKIPRHWPKNLPVIDSILCDDRDNLFIRTNERDEKEGIYHDVFDKHGRYFQKFAHPENEIIKVIKNDMAYCIIPSDENGIPLIKRYLLKWGHNRIDQHYQETIEKCATSR
jgi:hypothetical protein